MKLNMYLGIQNGTRFVEVGYWRNAYYIHSWIVNTLANGVDKGQEIPVNAENLEKLLELCKFVKNNRGADSPILPKGSGFFYGCMKHDDCCNKDIDDTIRIITEAIAQHPGGEFVYQASR